jgi:hypothetical protein
MVIPPRACDKFARGFLTLSEGGFIYYKGHFIPRCLWTRHLDKVYPTIAFDYNRYSNETKVLIGDIEPNGWKTVNATIYSKISGGHTISAEERGGKKGDRNRGLDIYVNSSIGVTFLDEKATRYIRIDNKTQKEIYQKKVEKGEETTIKMQIDNPMGFVGDVSLSIQETGFENELENHNGNGWIDQEVFAHIEPKSIRIQKPNETVVFRIVPRTTGTLYLIPHFMVNGKVLLFDHVNKLQTWDDSCEMGYGSGQIGPPDQDIMKFTAPTICSKSTYKPRSISFIKVEKEFIAMAIACIILSCVISVIDLYRRYKQEQGYLDKGIKKKGNGKITRRGKEPKKRAKDKQ